jgi:hypothetical protein
MFRADQIERRVSISHRGGKVRIFIARRKNRRSSFLATFVFATAVFVFTLSSFWPGLSQRWSRDTIYFMVFPGIFALVCFIISRGAFWDAFGTEEIVAGGGTFQWKRQALWWKRHFQTALSDVEEVSAKSQLGLAGVQLTCKRGTYELGSGILPSEAADIERALRRFLLR